MPSDAIQKLSISTLKAVLFRNHVNTGMIVEKAELVAKVQALVSDERLEREAAARRQEEEDRELQEALEWSRREHAEQEAARQGPPSEDAAASHETQGAAQGANDSGSDSAEAEAETSGAGQDRSSTPPQSQETRPAAPKLTPKAQAMASHLERTGLCVICQDEEANIAIVDCG